MGQDVCHAVHNYMISMCYIACDPKQPDQAWGLVADTPENAPFLDRDLTLWRNSGAVVKHVSHEIGLRYLHNYVNRRQLELSI